MGNNILGPLVKAAIDAYIATLTDAEKADWTDARRTALLKTMFNPVEDYQAPIGSIIAWHKDLTGVPSLPGNWAECNGQTISDSDSPLDGITLPDLNGDKRFLRGGSISGTEQEDAFQEWQAVIDSGGNTYYGYGALPGNTTLGAATAGTILPRFATGLQGSAAKIKAGDDGTNGAPRMDTETRPVNMSVVFIIRIK